MEFAVLRQDRECLVPEVAFFNGASLKPPPPGTSKQARVRYYDIYEGAFDEKQFTAWVKQATKFPGEKM